MTMTLTDLQTLAHNNSLQARNVDYLVYTSKFSTAFEHATEIQRQQLCRGVRDLDTVLINTTVRSILYDCLEAKNIHELRDIGKQCSIYGVTKLNKAQLIHLIKKERKS